MRRRRNIKIKTKSNRAIRKHKHKQTVRRANKTVKQIQTVRETDRQSYPVE